MYDQPQACPLANSALESVVFVASLFPFDHDSDAENMLSYRPVTWRNEGWMVTIQFAEPFRMRGSNHPQLQLLGTILTR
jgi:hypothetical protein